MSQSTLRRFVVVAALGAAGMGSLVAPAFAQVAYANRGPLDSFLSPYDETYDTHPAFEIYPNPYGGAPAVRIVERCAYPDGWNAGDFSRDLNGVPAGLDHTCPAAPVGGRVRSRY